MARDARDIYQVGDHYYTNTNASLFRVARGLSNEAFLRRDAQAPSLSATAASWLPLTA